MVSVIIPNYNHGQYVGDAIRSVLAQDYPCREIIIVDDGSTDDSRERIAHFGEQVRYIFQANAGLSAARNTGIRASKGSLIAVLDADDMFEPGFLSQLVPVLEAHPEAGGIHCGYQFVDQNNNLLPQIEVREHAPEQLYDLLLDGDYFVPESIILRRCVYDVVGLFAEDLRACEDWDLWLRAAKNYKILNFPAILTRHRVLAGSMSTDPLRMLEGRLAVLKKHLGKEPLRSGSSTAHRAYARAYLGSCVEYWQYGNASKVSECFQRAFLLCPDLMREVDTFYQLGCGDQAKGYMGDLKSLRVERTRAEVLALVDGLFPDSTDYQDPVKKAIYGTAHLALGMLAYGTRELELSRRCFAHAVAAEPCLILDARLVGRWIKTLVPRSLLNRLRTLHG